MDKKTRTEWSKQAPSPFLGASWVEVPLLVAQQGFDAGFMVKQFRGPGVGFTLTETRPVEGRTYAMRRSTVEEQL